VEPFQLSRHGKLAGHRLQAQNAEEDTGQRGEDERPDQQTNEGRGDRPVALAASAETRITNAEPNNVSFTAPTKGFKSDAT
jgi:hypothetical protein